MKVGPLWNKFTCSGQWFANDLRQYGHFFKWNNKKEDILEVGCGNGFITRTITYPYLRDRLGMLMAVDKQQYAIDTAKEYNAIDKIEYRQMDAMDEGQVEAMRGKFHKIFVPMVAHWISDNGTLLQRLRTMLKPNGQILVTTLIDSPMHHSFCGTQKVWAKYLPDERVFYDYTDQSIKCFTELATKAGFKVDICQQGKLIGITEHFPDIVRLMVSMYDKLNLIPEELLEKYYQDHIRTSMEVCTYLGDPDKFQFCITRLACIASSGG